MKKSIIRAVSLALILLLSLSAFVAFASEDFIGDVVVKKAKAYTDYKMKRYALTIPAYTALTVSQYPVAGGKHYTDYSVARVRYNGKIYYIKTSKLVQDRYGSALEAYQ